MQITFPYAQTEINFGVRAEQSAEEIPAHNKGVPIYRIPATKDTVAATLLSRMSDRMTKLNKAELFSEDDKLKNIKKAIHKLNRQFDTMYAKEESALERMQVKEVNRICAMLDSMYTKRRDTLGESRAASIHDSAFRAAMKAHDSKWHDIFNELSRKYPLPG